MACSLLFMFENCFNEKENKATITKAFARNSSISPISLILDLKNALASRGFLRAKTLF